MRGAVKTPRSLSSKHPLDYRPNPRVLEKSQLTFIPTAMSRSSLPEMVFHHRPPWDETESDAIVEHGEAPARKVK